MRGGVLVVALVLVAGAVFALLSRDATPPPIAAGQTAPVPGATVHLAWDPAALHLMPGAAHG